MPWHLTPIENIEAIQRDGLRPSIGRLSQEVGETEALVHMFSTFEDLQGADWLWDAFDDDAKLALYHVALPAAEGAWTELQDGVPTESLRLMSLDAGSISDADVIRALKALDRVVDPLNSVDDFRRTRVAVRASSFGQLIGDAAWDGEETPFLVYAGSYWIEETDGAEHVLTIGNESWMTGKGETFEDLEQRLFDYGESEHRLGREPGDEVGPSL